MMAKRLALDTCNAADQTVLRPRLLKAVQESIAGLDLRRWRLWVSDHNLYYVDHFLLEGRRELVVEIREPRKVLREPWEGRITNAHVAAIRW